MNLFRFSIVKLLVAVSLLVVQPRWGIAVSVKRLLYAVWRNGLLTQTTFSLQTFIFNNQVVKPRSINF